MGVLFRRPGAGSTGPENRSHDEGDEEAAVGPVVEKALSLDQQFDFTAYRLSPGLRVIQKMDGLCFTSTGC